MKLEWLSMLKVQMAAKSLVGRRKHNEDDWRMGERAGLAWAVLADGAGGHDNGAQASDLVVRVLAMNLQAATSLDAQRLHAAAFEAHELLLAQQGPQALEKARMHATLVALWVDLQRGQALWTHVGDSRLYLLRGGSVHHRTKDDSLVQQLVDAGLLGEEAARSHPRKNQLVAAMGAEGELQPHTLQRPFELRAGDKFLLASDGWWDSLNSADLQQSAYDSTDAGTWLARMESLIAGREGPDQDNYTGVALCLAAGS